MTTQASIPAKWYVPFANGDASRVEIPVTTADPTRASQTLGFPPLTMQPPESGGVPPQGEDFNGGMNQIARVAWWVLNGGGWPYDASFATNVNINGYPNGATLQSADFRGDWINTADSNQNNPDTTGTGWVPGFQYGVTALAGLTGGTVTPTPAQAAKNSITLAGTLGSALTIVLPTWLKNWTITNNTTGAFVTIVKTSAGSGVTIPQNGAPTRVSGDGTNIVQSPENIAPATTATQALQFGQVSGVVGASRNMVMLLTAASATATLTADEIVVESALGGLRYGLAAFSQTINLATTGAGGMDTGAPPVTGYVAIYAIYNPATGARALLARDATSAARSEVYNGANMPAGFTASALVSVWRTTTSLLATGFQFDRVISIGAATALTTSTTTGSPSAIAISGIIPPNAKAVTGGTIQAGSSTTSTVALSVMGNISAFGQFSASFATSSAQAYTVPYGRLTILVPQNIYYTATNTAGTPTYVITISGYEF